MRTAVLVSIAVVALNSNAVAQSNAGGGQLAIDDLRAPTSPAFVLLDISPSAVERPQNPKTLTLNLLNAVTRAEGFPRNYALEVAPYWLASHPDLTFETYQRPSFVQGILQTLALSVATTPLRSNAGGTQDPGSRLGFGARVNLLSGRPNPGLTALVKSLDDIDMNILESGADIGALRDQARGISLKMQTMDAQRVGFIVAAAGGGAWSFPSDDFDQRHNDRWGIWVTPTYRLLACAVGAPACSATIDFIGVVRSIHDAGQKAKWDVGGRLLWQPTKQFDVSAEVLRRSKASDGSAAAGQRTVAIVEYRIQEGLAVYGSFGKDVRNAANYQPLVSILGVNIGFGKPVLKR